MKPKFFSSQNPLCTAIFLVASAMGAQADDQYFDGSGTNALTASKWGGTAAGAKTSSFTTGNIAVFATVNGTGSGSGGISVGGIRAEESFTFTSPSGTLLTGGAVATINVFSGKVLDFGSLSISTAAGTGFIKSGSGVYASAGGAFTGGFTVNAGTMIARGTNAMGSGGLLTLNGGTVASNATRDLTGKYTNIVIGGNIQFGEFSTIVALASDTVNLTFNNTMSLGGATRTLTLGNRGNVTFGGVISGTSGSGLVFAAASGADSTAAGNGTFAITGTANTFTGPVSINGPEVTFAGDGGFGNTANTVNIDGGRLTFAASFTITAGRGIQLGDTAGTSISAKGGSTVLTYNGVISDITGKTGAWAKQGSGTLQLGGASTYTGATAISNGILQLTTGNDRLPTGTVVSLGQASSINLGTLDLNGQSQQIAGLNSTGGTNTSASNNTVSSSAVATLTLGGSGNYSYGDGTNANSGVISGAISLIKSGNGTQILGDANTYTGITTISAGTLVINGDQTAATGNVSVSGILAGSGGTVGGNTTINLNGHLAAGDGTAGSVGTQTFNGTLGLASGSIFDWDITTSSNAYDKVTLGASKLAVTDGAIFNVVSSTAFSDAFWNLPHTWSDIFATNNLANFTVANFTYSAAGAVVGAPTTEGLFSVSGNTLTWSAVPEPTSALAGILLGVGLLRRRRVA